MGGITPLLEQLLIISPSLSGRGSQVRWPTVRSPALPGRWWCNGRWVRAAMQEAPPRPDPAVSLRSTPHFGGGASDQWPTLGDGRISRWQPCYFFFIILHRRIGCLTCSCFGNLVCFLLTTKKKKKRCNWEAVFFLTFVLFSVCHTVVHSHPHAFVKHSSLLSPCDCRCNKVDSCSLKFCVAPCSLPTEEI